MTHKHCLVDRNTERDEVRGASEVERGFRNIHSMPFFSFVSHKGKNLQTNWCFADILVSWQTIWGGQKLVSCAAWASFTSCNGNLLTEHTFVIHKHRTYCQWSCRQWRNPAENGCYTPNEESTDQTPMPLTLNCSSLLDDQSAPANVSIMDKTRDLLPSMYLITQVGFWHGILRRN